MYIKHQGPVKRGCDSFLFPRIEQRADQTQHFTVHEVERIHHGSAIGCFLNQILIGENFDRCARLLAVLMGLQAELPALDFSGVRGKERQRYIAAIHAGLDGDYEPMTEVFRQIIARSLRNVRRQ